MLLSSADSLSHPNIWGKFWLQPSGPQAFIISARSSQAQLAGLVMNQLMRYFKILPGPECGCEVHDDSRPPGTSRPADFSLITVLQIVISLMPIGLLLRWQAWHSSGVGLIETFPNPVITVHSSKISFGQFMLAVRYLSVRYITMPATM